MLKDGIPRIKIRRHVYYYPSALSYNTFPVWSYQWVVWWDDEYAPADGSPPPFAKHCDSWPKAMEYAERDVW